MLAWTGYVESEMAAGMIFPSAAKAYTRSNFSFKIAASKSLVRSR